MSRVEVEASAPPWNARPRGPGSGPADVRYRLVVTPCGETSNASHSLISFHANGINQSRRSGPLLSLRVPSNVILPCADLIMPRPFEPNSAAFFLLHPSKQGGFTLLFTTLSLCLVT
jgi:hypothetical protein